MSSKEIVITSGVKRGQILVLMLALALVSIFIVFFLQEPSIASFSTLFVVVVALLLLNVVLKNQVDIHKSNNQIIFNNLWFKRVMNQTDIVDIRPVRFIFCYP